MAWNESFTAADGGWGGAETSFATAGPKDTASNKIAEKLAVPVTIRDLVDAANADEKYVLGDYPFSTVLVMGNVRSYETQDTSTTYVIYDPEDEYKEYRVMTYHGIDDSQGSECRNPFVEGTRVMAVGKLRNLNDVYGIIAYDVKEVANDKEYHAFTLEAKLAKIYFSKNVHDLLQTSEGSKLTGTCIGAPAVNPNAAAAGGNNPFNRSDAGGFSSQPSRIYNNTPAAAGNAGAHGMSGQRGRIMEILEAERDNYGENGMSIDDVKSKVGTMNMNQLRSDLEFLVSEGHVYNTINDDHFALIS